MEWQPIVKDLFNNVVLKMPETVRPIIAPILQDTSEKKCEMRQGKDVAERDLIIALFEVTPAAFQPTMIADLDSMGVEYKKYLLLIQSGFKHHTDFNKLLADVQKIGEFTKVKCNINATQKVLDAYKDFFTGSSISIRTTTLPEEKRDISVRYVEIMMPHKVDPYTIAIKNGLLRKSDLPLHKMFNEAKKQFDTIGYGVDLDVRIGLSKIWLFFVPTSIDIIKTMSTVPSSAIKNIRHFKKFGLNVISLIGFDFRNNTMNFYLMIKDPSKASPEKYTSMLRDLGFEESSKEVMKKCCDARTIYYTFNWDTEDVERICFGMICPTKEEVPIQFHPLMKEFVEKVPFSSETRRYIYSIAFSRKGQYFKVENDYNGTMIELLLMACQGGI